MSEVATRYIEALSGRDNISTVGNCVTKLSIKDNAIVNDLKLKSLGARGVIRPTKGTIKIIVGTNMQFLVEAIKV